MIILFISKNKCCEGASVKVGRGSMLNTRFHSIWYYVFLIFIKKIKLITKLLVFCVKRKDNL